MFSNTNVYGTDPNASDITGAQQITVGYGEDVDNIDFGAQQVGVNDEDINIPIETSANDLLMGSDGENRFVIESDRLDTIANFTPGEDLIELPDSIGFEQLEITQGQGESSEDTVIFFETNAIAILRDTNSTEISLSDFV